MACQSLCLLVCFVYKIARNTGICIIKGFGHLARQKFFVVVVVVNWCTLLSVLCFT